MSREYSRARYLQLLSTGMKKINTIRGSVLDLGEELVEEVSLGVEGVDDYNSIDQLGEESIHGGENGENHLLRPDKVNGGNNDGGNFLQGTLVHNQHIRAKSVHQIRRGGRVREPKRRKEDLLDQVVVDNIGGLDAANSFSNKEQGAEGSLEEHDKGVDPNEVGIILGVVVAYKRVGVPVKDGFKYTRGEQYEAPRTANQGEVPPVYLSGAPLARADLSLQSQVRWHADRLVDDVDVGGVDFGLAVNEVQERGNVDGEDGFGVRAAKESLVAEEPGEDFRPDTPRQGHSGLLSSAEGGAALVNDPQIAVFPGVEVVLQLANVGDQHVEVFVPGLSEQNGRPHRSLGDPGCLAGVGVAEVVVLEVQNGVDDGGLSTSGGACEDHAPPHCARGVSWQTEMGLNDLVAVGDERAAGLAGPSGGSNEKVENDEHNQLCGSLGVVLQKAPELGPHKPLKIQLGLYISVLHNPVKHQVLGSHDSNHPKNSENVMADREPPVPILHERSFINGTKHLKSKAR
ncbi:hypothetical protein OJ253_3514 [Cryptosporidium canis]|uniref:Uncharacterized protein n=1 Tax=Cryptosporidium canis TaxID=195482 RepID=A0A9D5DJN2_9CRYT|nr:hypothetical protein OJ253_3514 [Cryptosporidium canis]